MKNISHSRRVMIRMFLAAGSVILPMLVSSCSLLSVFRERDHFIRVEGTHFVADGKPYYYAGANMWHGCYLGSPGSTGDRPRLLRELDSLVIYHITNLRLLAASEQSYLLRSIRPAIQTAPGITDDSLLIGLDYVLDEMSKRHMHAVLFLNNYWQWSGGMAQYVVWATGAKGADPDNPSEGYGKFMDFSAEFYSTPGAVRLYEEYVKRIVTRRNTVNGRLYSEDPTIMSWQLANEPRPGRDNEFGVRNLPVFDEWVDREARYIHSLDTCHLVSAGSEGTIAMMMSPQYYLDAHKSPAVDYLTFHLWPLNWGWFNPDRIAETLPSSEEKSLGYIDLHIGLARTLNKPIVMEEFGMARDSGRFMPGTPVSARNHFYELVYRRLYDSAAAGAPAAGSNFWTWGGEGKARHTDGDWREGDSFLGDPPQEPQGRNSIFLSDTATLNMIRTHALMMEGLDNRQIDVVGKK